MREVLIKDFKRIPKVLEALEKENNIEELKVEEKEQISLL